jgi:hypothetical protein
MATYKLIKFDNLNWAIEKTYTGKDKEGNPVEHVKIDSYHHDVGMAVKKLYHDTAKDECPPSEALDTLKAMSQVCDNAVSRVEQIARELKEAVA